MNMVPREQNNDISNHSVLNTGNNNTTTYHSVNLHGVKPVPSISLIYNVCKVISEIEFEAIEKYSIEKNSEWNAKIAYNEIQSYKTIFQDQYLSYDKVEQALKTIPKRDLIIQNIRTIYQKEKVKNDNKDEVLNQVFEELSNLVVTSGISCGNELYEEEKNDAIYSVMFYTFTKCQLLEPLPDYDKIADE
ncbi:hypothetical protein IW492_03410 [Enterococcus sp. BWB1-3]|uniref:hypothetical protein n=1 Tax=Enterococcus sp. BWB1-3 TaxID=2787713 RepID=UPI0019204D4A|nr:hypothetical protein [Enterococcus sp. BWB1-3]MBL1228280.1 hypothetical protein [Enterococcus sp. BWB1-3]